VYGKVRDHAGNLVSQSFTYTVIGQPNELPVANPQLVTMLEDIPSNKILIGLDPNHDALNFILMTTQLMGFLVAFYPTLFIYQLLITMMRIVSLLMFLIVFKTLNQLK
jgi:hypothetical protein